jgi:hypothetical protein
MQKLISGLLALIMAGCNWMMIDYPPDQDSLEQNENPTLQPEPAQTQSPLENLGPAPELENDIWLNTDVPLRLADLRGRVVLLDMWTFG